MSCGAHPELAGDESHAYSLLVADQTLLLNLETYVLTQLPQSFIPNGHDPNVISGCLYVTFPVLVSFLLRQHGQFQIFGDLSF